VKLLLSNMKRDWIFEQYVIEIVEQKEYLKTNISQEKDMEDLTTI